MGTANITREQAQQRSVVVTAIAYRVTVDVSGHGLEAPDATFRSHSELDFESTGGTTHLDIIADEIVSATLDDSPIDISDFDGYRLGLPELGEGVHT
ncbi:MAG: aminopeptidase N, partial [Arachnia propionica]